MKRRFVWFGGTAAAASGFQITGGTLCFFMKVTPAPSVNGNSRKQTILSPVRNAARPITGNAGSWRDTVTMRRTTILPGSGSGRRRPPPWLRIRPAPPPRRTRREKYALTAASRTRNSRSSAPAAAKSFPPRTGPAPRPPAEIPIRRRPASPLTADRLLTAARSLLMASRFRLTAVRADMGNIPPFVCRFSIPTAGFLMRKQSRTSAQRIW